MTTSHASSAFCQLMIRDATGSLLAFGFGNSLQIVSVNSHSETIEVEDLEPVHSDFVRCAAFHSSNHLVTFGDDKSIVLWRRNDVANEKGKRWERLAVGTSRKRVSSAAFTANGHLVFSDKFGDVFFYNGVEDIVSEQTPAHIMGHFSMVLCLVLSQDDRYLITGDRDEKIRVSRFPRVFNIETFCLGHTLFVTSLVVPQSSQENAPWLISGSADSTIRCWNYLEGTLLDTLNIGDFVGSSAIVQSIITSPTHPIMAVLCEGMPVIVLMHLSLSPSPTLHVMALISLPRPLMALSFDGNGRLVGSDRDGCMRAWSLTLIDRDGDSPNPKRSKTARKAMEQSDESMEGGISGKSELAAMCSCWSVAHTSSEAYEDLNHSCPVVDPEDRKRIEQSMLLSTLKKAPKTKEEA